MMPAMVSSSRLRRSLVREMINTGTLLNDLVTASTTDDNEVKDEEKDEGSLISTSVCSLYHFPYE